MNKTEKQCREAAIREYSLRGAAALGRDREPFALAVICGSADSSEISGEASFYYTPLGVLVSVWMKGFEARHATYNITISDTADARMGTSSLPPLYERGGYAFFSSLTGKLSPAEVLGKRLAVSKYECGGYTEVASAHILPERARRREKIV